MKYSVSRNGYLLGNYSLPELQNEVAAGNILPTDSARTEAGEEWAPVRQIVGAASASGVGGGTAAQPTRAGNRPVPPDLHWFVLFLATQLTAGLFGLYWAFKQIRFAESLRTNYRPMTWLWRAAAAFPLGILGLLLLASAGSGVGSTVVLLAFLLFVVSVLKIGFNLKNALEEYYNSVEPIGIQLSTVLTFLFTIVYIQYHLSRIRAATA